jgi:hypothetical protein
VRAALRVRALTLSIAVVEQITVQISTSYAGKGPNSAHSSDHSAVTSPLSACNSALLVAYRRLPC